jgi:signal transduction histidine kinase
LAGTRRTVFGLAAQFTALILVLLLLVSTLVLVLVSRGSDDANARALADASRIDSPQDAPPGVFVTIVDNGRTMVSRDMPAGLPDTAAIAQVQQTGQTVQSTEVFGGQSYLVQTSGTHGDRIVQAALNEQESQVQFTRVFWALVISVIVAALAAAALSTWMARRAIRPLADALELQRRFVADASHELRTPLTLLSTRAQLLRRSLGHGGSPPGETSDRIDEIVDDTRTLAAILEDLLLAADPREADGGVLIDAADAAVAAVASLAAEAATRGLVLTSSLTAHPSVRASRGAIDRIFTALITNALDHAATRVTVEVGIAERGAIISVIDDGPGFDAAFIHRAFERFASSRAEAPGDGGGRHYGIGLAVVAEITHRYGGSVAIDPPRPAGGARVRVRLPLATPEVSS